MPLNKEATLRYHIIDECIKNQYKPYPTMEDIIEKCSDKLGKEFTVSTIQKDIKAMKEDDVLGYNAPIKFSRAKLGYYYDNPEYSIKKVPLHSKEIEALEFAAGIIQQYKGTELSGTFSMAVDKVISSLKLNTLDRTGNKKKVIFPEKSTEFKGADKIDLLMHCIIEKIPISFVHYNYREQFFIASIVHPYFLKEHRNRWYLAGYSETHKQLRLFGLDRVEDIYLLKKKFYEIPDLNPEELFRHSYGVFISKKSQARKIKLEFSANVAGYVIAQPINDSQKIIEYKERGSIVIEVFIYPCREFKQFLLSYGSDIRILSPLDLREEIINENKGSIRQNEGINKRS